eukprot:TRINITY_DN5242_c0_g1_i1.p1 TRINITY_DN5242_c0_g1~~TRINITY_DN5242_c0_g1_i1.p1  ORF type:complete len:337 (+),score=95.89 TRINITY_DN5242_c0_g1_i1:26-1012(+)
MPGHLKRRRSSDPQYDAMKEACWSSMPVLAGVGIPLLIVLFLLFGGSPHHEQTSHLKSGAGSKPNNVERERLGNEFQHALHKLHTKDVAPALDGSAEPEAVYSHAAFLIQTHRYGEAIPYLERAAFVHRMPYAYHVLGELHIKGKGGVHKDFRKGFEYILESANLGHVPSYVTLGFFYEKGVGTSVDLEAAVGWYRKAAEVGDLLGMSNLGMMYRLGSGVPVDHEESLKWLQHAAFLHDARAMFELGNAYYNGYGVRPDMSKALHWYKQAAEFDDDSNPSLYFNLGNMYRYGFGESANVTKAMQWYEKAADLGHVKAAYELQDLKEIN